MVVPNSGTPQDGFDYHLDPVDGSLTINLPPLRRSGHTLGLLLAIGVTSFVAFWGPQAAGAPRGFAWLMGAFGACVIGLVVMSLAWEWTRGERLVLTKGRLVRERWFLGVSRRTEFDLDRVRNLRLGRVDWVNEASWSVSAPGVHVEHGPRRTEVGLAFDDGPKYVRIARHLEGERAVALFKVIASHAPACVEPGEAYHLQESLSTRG